MFHDDVFFLKRFAKCFRGMKRCFRAQLFQHEASVCCGCEQHHGAVIVSETRGVDDEIAVSIPQAMILPAIFKWRVNWFYG